MTVEIDLSRLPEDGKVDISATWSVSAHTARRKATGLVGDRIGNLLFGSEPNLVIGERIVWRVPIMLGNAEVGVIGQVGTLDIDANTAAPVTSEGQLNQIREYAAYLAERSAHPAT